MGFLPYLPQDNSSLEDARTEETIAIISEDLAQLLRAAAPEFWSTVRGDLSLHTCLNSYLQFARCAVSSLTVLRGSSTGTS